MTVRSETFWPRLRRGLTLIEALAAMAILGAVLAGILTANARMSVQAARASRRVEACRIADELLNAWWPKRDELPRSAGGQVKDRPGWTWRTRVVDSKAASDMNAEVVALEIFAPGSNGASGAAAARVEVLLGGKSQ